VRSAFGTRLLILLLLSAGALRAGADRGLDDARRAQALLGPDRWSQIVRVENTNRRGAYPRVVYGVVFELVGILWFYTDTDGTQSMSLRPGKLEEEKAELGPLLRAIDSGFVRWTILPDATAAETAHPRFNRQKAAAIGAKPEDGPLPNGCFIESLARLQQLLVAGTKIAHPRLFSFYAANVTQGHTVLVYETPRALVVYDSTSSGRAVEFPLHGPVNALDVARAISRAAVQRALFLPLDRGYAPTSLLVPENGDTRLSANVPREGRTPRSG